MGDKTLDTFRVYPDGYVIHEDDFADYDSIQPTHDDYREFRALSSLTVFEVEMKLAVNPNYGWPV